MALHDCCVTGDVEAFKRIMTSQPAMFAKLVNQQSYEYDGRTLLHIAAQSGGLDTVHQHLEIMKILLEHGALVNSAVRFETPLDLAIESAHVDAALLLLNHGANPSNKGEYGMTPFMRACEKLGIDNGNEEADAAAAERVDTVLSAMVAAGASISDVDESGQSPLHHAAVYGNIRAVQWLIAHGASADAVDGSGMTPLDWAQDRGFTDVIQLLKAK